jgi:hypothetical protein
MPCLLGNILAINMPFWNAFLGSLFPHFFKMRVLYYRWHPKGVRKLFEIRLRQHRADLTAIRVNWLRVLLHGYSWSNCPPYVLRGQNNLDLANLKMRLFRLPACNRSRHPIRVVKSTRLASHVVGVCRAFLP